MSEQQSSAVSAPSDLRAALQDIAESEPIPTFAEAWKWCKEIAQAALTCPEPQASADSEPIAWATPIADGTHQLTRHEEVAGRWRDCNLKVIELYARPQPERAEPQASAVSDEVASLRSRLAMAEGCAALAGINVDVHAIDIATLKSTMAKLIAAEKEIKRLRAEPQSVPSQYEPGEQDVRRFIESAVLWIPSEGVKGRNGLDATETIDLVTKRLVEALRSRCQAESAPQAVGTTEGGK